MGAEEMPMRDWILEVFWRQSWQDLLIDWLDMQLVRKEPKMSEDFGLNKGMNDGVLLVPLMSPGSPKRGEQCGRWLWPGHNCLWCLIKHPRGDIKKSVRQVCVEFKEQVEMGDRDLRVIRFEEEERIQQRRLKIHISFLRHLRMGISESD